MTPNDPNLLWIILMALQGSTPQPIPEPLRGAYMADPSAPAPIASISVDADGIQAGNMRCRAASLSGTRNTSQGHFVCTRTHAEPFAMPQAKPIRLRLSMDSHGALSVAGLDGDDSKLRFLPATAANAPAPRH
jgi:hypothetical protein